MSKSAWTQGRTGISPHQDWYKVVEMAAALHMQFSNSKVVGATGFKSPDDPHGEIWYYEHAFKSFGLLKDSDYVLIDRGIDTITQFDEVIEYVNTHNGKLIVVCTPLHYSRMKFLCWWERNRVRVLEVVEADKGIPRASEIKNDIIMKYALPVIYLLGMKKLFLWYVYRRRAAGKL